MNYITLILLKFLKFMIKVGIIGCGRIAGGFETDKKESIMHMQTYKKNKHTKIVAISDINSKN